MAATTRPKPFNAQVNPGTWLVLYVDDDSLNQTLVEMLLSQKPEYKVLVADDQEDVEQALEQEPCLPDIILMDHQLANVTGAELIGWMRQQYSPDLVFVLCTGRARTEAAALAEDAHAACYLCKPYTMKDLMSVLARFGMPQ